MSYLDARAAAEYAGYVTNGVVTEQDLKAFRAYARRHLRKYHAGRALRFKSEEIDAAMDGGDPIVEKALRLAGIGGRR